MAPAQNAPGKTPYKFTFSTGIFVALLVGTGLAGILLAQDRPLLAWILTAAFMAALVFAAGYNIKHLYFGFLIDSRNRYSLSRLQTLLWTLIVLSAYLTAVFINIRNQVADPLAVAIPEELWVLMGISVTSLLGSPLLVNQKRSSAPASAQAANAAKKKAAKKKVAKKTVIKSPTGEPDDAEPLRVDGEVVEKIDPADAEWSDLFKGETAENVNYLDISRVQMFYFTFILALAYCFYLGQMFMAYGRGEGYASIDSLPTLSGGMLALLGISHTAYLGNKAIPARKAPAPKPGETE